MRHPKSVVNVFAAHASVASLCLIGLAAGCAAELKPIHPTTIAAEQGIAIEDLVGEAQHSQVEKADRLWTEQKNGAVAFEVLQSVATPASYLLQARYLRQMSRFEEAKKALAQANQDPRIAELVQLEDGLIAWERGDAASAILLLRPLLKGSRAIASQVVEPLAKSLLANDPAQLLEAYPQLLSHLPDSLDGRSQLLEYRAQALEKLGRLEEAKATRVQQYLEEPVSSLSPVEPPGDVKLGVQALLDRAQRLLDAHRNDRAQSSLQKIDDALLTTAQRCQKNFMLGMAARKVRGYSSAESYLGRVIAECQDPILVRRAAYLHIKVVSIRDGLEAIPLIEQFVERYPGDSMVDDVLFWAGDIMQRRERLGEAKSYYQRAQEATPNGDHCAEARWRVAWMTYRRGDLVAAKSFFEQISQNKTCPSDMFESARAQYWLGRLAFEQQGASFALENYERVLQLDPLGFYAQQALQRIWEIDQDRAKKVAPIAHSAEKLAVCPHALVHDAAFHNGYNYLAMGLASDAAREFLSIATSKQNILGASHAASLGVEENIKKTRMSVPEPIFCDAGSEQLLLTLLLDRTGAYHDSHWRMRTDFAAALSHQPSAHEWRLWQVAYPLAYHSLIDAAERESGLAEFTLAALVREESALDPDVVSWASAYGLTQLILASGQTASRKLQPPITLNNAEELLNPVLNTRLGAALLASQIKRYKGNLGMALAAYNAGDEPVKSWWPRIQGQPFDIFAEELPIQETRGYVKRVLRTLGIYRWLYQNEIPILPVASTIPLK